MRRQGNLKDYQGNEIIPNTSSQAVLDSAKNQALSQTLSNTPDYAALGYAAFSTALAYTAGYVVYHENMLWKFTEEKAAGDWDPTKVVMTSIRGEAGETTVPRVEFIERSFGKYDTVREITLSQAKSNKYVNVSGEEVSGTGYGISNSVEVLAGDILLIPSAQAVPADVSVVARVVTRTYQKVINYTYTYQQANPELYDTATADYDQTLVYTAVYDTSGETPVLTGWTRNGETYSTLPATHEVTESYYEPLVKQSVAAMPSTGYYVYLCPTPMTIVISGYTATVTGGVCLVVGWGIFKNICTNFVGAPGQAVLAQAFAVLFAAVDGLMAQLENLGETKAVSIDFAEQPRLCGGPMVIEGSGAPAGLDVPRMVGQRYHDITNNKCYEAFRVTGSISDWVLLN